MKIHILVPLTVGLLYWNAFAQSADVWVNLGRYNLAQHDIPDANAAFAQALATSPTNEDANVFYAFTRLLSLPSQSAGSNFLTRIGLPAAGRDVFDWTSMPPTDASGLVIAPAGVNADEFIARLRTNVLPAVEGALGNLAMVSHTNYTLNLLSNETSIASVTVDYGDLKLILAGLYAAEYFIYTANSQNVDAQLASLRSLYTEGKVSASEILADYPRFLTCSTTNDLQHAYNAFTNAVETYFQASEIIRSRPTNEVTLFTYDPAMAKSEGEFRLVLQDLFNSLCVGPQMFVLWPDITVDLSPQFAGPIDLRDFLPTFQGNAIALGTLPDPTFGGMIGDLSPDNAESLLGKYFRMLPVGYPPELSITNTVNVTFKTLLGHYYVLETSTNLSRWDVAAQFTAAGSWSTLVDPQPPGMTKRFYRLRDDTGFMIFTGVVFDQATSLPITGAQVYCVSGKSSAFTDASGRFILQTTLPIGNWSYYLQVSAPGYSTNSAWYYDYAGTGRISGVTIYLSRPPGNDAFVNRFTLSGPNVSTNGNNSAATYESGEPYDANSGFGYKSVWFTWAVPTNGPYVLSVSSTSVYYPILAIYTGTQLSSLSKVADVIGSNYHATNGMNGTVGQIYQIEVDDYSGAGGPYTLKIVP